MSEIFLPAQTIDFDQLYNQFPPLGSNRRKLIFQSELRSLAGGNATFGLIAYPLWRNSAAHPWKTGKIVRATDTGTTGPGFPVEPFMAFGNIEVPLTKHALEPADEPGQIDKDKDAAFEKFLAFLKKVTENPTLLKESKLEFKKSKLTSNPHADYDVTLVSGQSSETAVTNPSPPADPSEG